METTAGIRLRMGTEDERTQRYETKQRSRLLTPGDLLKLCPQLQICVLQATPNETHVRTSSEREQTAYLRAFAAQLCAMGVPIVVTLPPMPSYLAVDVLAAFAATLPVPDEAAPLVWLDDAVEAARATILHRYDTEQDMWTETAYDVTCTTALEVHRPASH